MKIKGIKIIKEKAGVISERSCWVAFCYPSHMYIEDTLFALFWTMLTEWKHDKHLVGY